MTVAALPTSLVVGEPICAKRRTARLRNFSVSKILGVTPKWIRWTQRVIASDLARSAIVAFNMAARQTLVNRLVASSPRVFVARFEVAHSQPRSSDSTRLGPKPKESRDRIPLAAKRRKQFNEALTANSPNYRSPNYQFAKLPLASGASSDIGELESLTLSVGTIFLQRIVSAKALIEDRAKSVD
ncbi:MAG: hypothetical protein ACI9G1_001076 [Pirellulaceae bacterium]